MMRMMMMMRRIQAMRRMEIPATGR